MTGVSLNCEDSGACTIELGSDPIGIIEGTFESLTFIEIDPDYRGEGHGRAAVEAYLATAENRGVTEMETSTVTSSAMEHILRTNGFTRARHDPSHFECEFPKPTTNAEP